MSLTDKRLSINEMPVSEAPTTTIRVLLFTLTLPVQLINVMIDSHDTMQIDRLTHHLFRDHWERKRSLFLVKGISHSILNFSEITCTFKMFLFVFKVPLSLQEVRELSCSDKHKLIKYIWQECLLLHFEVHACLEYKWSNMEIWASINEIIIILLLCSLILGSLWEWTVYSWRRADSKQCESASCDTS